MAYIGYELKLEAVDVICNRRESALLVADNGRHLMMLTVPMEPVFDCWVCCEHMVLGQQLLVERLVMELVTRQVAEGVVEGVLVVLQQ